MREIRIYVDTDLAADSEIALPATAAHHVARVLRLGRGQPLTLFNGHGGQYAAVIESVNGREVRVSIQAHRPLERESPLTITLVQAVSRSRKMDATLQKAVELGVTAIHPVLSEHGQMRLDDQRLASRLDHWRGVLAGACEQCGRNRVPALATPQPLLGWLEGRDKAMSCLFLDPFEGQLLRELTAPASHLILLSGPEGGFSPAERKAALETGCTPIRLGPRILRTETAAPAAIAACQTLWGDLG